jgi:tetratricopeptide (TPR) repeat protein
MELRFEWNFAMPVYDAFISYSHAKDKPIAAALQSVIQKLGKPWYRRRALRVFRDDTSLSATPGLWPTIQQSLEQSRFLILLASPEAAVSPWVNKELAYWLEHKGADALFIAVTDGELVWDAGRGDFGGQAPLPPIVMGRFPGEPRWVDLTAYRQGVDKRAAKFTELAANFAAAIHGMPKEDLLSQEVRQQRRALALAWSAAGVMLLLAVATTVAMVQAYRAQAEAVKQEQIALNNLSDALMGYAITARLEIEKGDRDKALSDLEFVLEILARSPVEDPAFALLSGTIAEDFFKLGKAFSAAGEFDRAKISYETSMRMLDGLLQIAREKFGDRRGKLLAEGGVQGFGRPGEVYAIVPGDGAPSAIDHWRELLKDVTDRLVELPENSSR